jgi:hypothetical protein
VTHLTFGNDFNKPIEQILSHVTHLRFGKKFNQPIKKDILPNIMYLEFAYEFRGKIDDISALVIIRKKIDK